MLNDVVANYLGTLSEIEFFDAFAAILRAIGFYDVHLTHGPSEHGKDFIAKRVEDGSLVQYGIQTKVGDIGVADFRACRNQIESIRTTDLSHPSFDADTPRRAILATTGRLTGQAPTEAQEYKRKATTSSFGFDVWQINDLLEMMVDAPEAGLAGEPDAPLLGAIAAIHENTFSEASLDRLSVGWANPVGDTSGLWRIALAALVVSNRLARFGRRDLAALVGAHLVRAAWARSDNYDPPSEVVLSIADTGRALLVFHAWSLVEDATIAQSSPDGLALFDLSPACFLTYPVRCLRLLELFGLAGLAETDMAKRERLVSVCRLLIAKEPGASHPISDHWAVSIPPASLLLYSTDGDLIGRWLQEICVWLGDHYEADGVGLAGPWSDSDEEASMLYGGSLEHVDVVRRPMSLIASVLLDLASTLEMVDVYDTLINEIMACRINPTVVECDDGPGTYQDGESGVYIEAWVAYDGAFNDSEGWQKSGPHRRAEKPFLMRVGRCWDLLAICSVLRDRCFPLLLRQMSVE